MKPVFLDTSGLVAVVNSDDQGHATAERVWQSLISNRTPLLTTSLILIEIADGLARIQHRQTAIDLYDRLQSSPLVEVVQTTSSEEVQAWALYRSRSDKEWGMTDCISMVIMQHRDITDVFSSDRDFVQAGFNSLLVQ